MIVASHSISFIAKKSCFCENKKLKVENVPSDLYPNLVSAQCSMEDDSDPVVAEVSRLLLYAYTYTNTPTIGGGLSHCRPRGPPILASGKQRHTQYVHPPTHAHPPTCTVSTASRPHMHTHPPTQYPLRPAHTCTLTHPHSIHCVPPTCRILVC